LLHGASFGPLIGVDGLPQSITLFFTDPAHFLAAIPNDGTSRRVLITGHGRFRARLTWIALDSLRVVAGEESLSRIAFVTVPDHMVLIVLQRQPYPAPVWGDITMHAGELVTFGPGSCAHARTDGPCRWATLLVPVRDLARLGRVVVGKTFSVPSGIQRWRPPRAPDIRLRQLHAAAIRAVETGHPELISPEAAHGLDQQMIEVLIECLCSSPTAADTPVARRYREIMAQFEAVIANQDHGNLRTAEICTALGISQWVLCRACQMHLGMSAASYLRLRKKQRVHLVPRSRLRHVARIDLHYGPREPPGDP
jgi:AraC-like DNA-binding protein